MKNYKFIKGFFLTLILFTLTFQVSAVHLLIPMDESQKNHLKAYGITYWALRLDIEVKWLLNHRGGSFLMLHSPAIENECVVRGVTF